MSGQQAPYRFGSRGAAILGAVGLLLGACADDAATDPEPPAVAAPPGEGPDELDQPEPGPEQPDEEPAEDAEPREQRRAADLPTARTEVTGTSWDGRVVAVGGLTSSGALADVDLYDPQTDTWETAPDLPIDLP